MRYLLRGLRRIALLMLTLVLIWLGGFAWFVVSSLSLRADTAGRTDAVVVLTGGKLRLETGIELLAAGKANKLFVSGVNQQVDKQELLRGFGALPDTVTCCIVLGHAADNTFGNARETATWMHEEGYRSMRLVTSWYHMRRSLLEFRRAMPDIAILPHPVFAHNLETERWLGWHGALMLLVEEYDKFLASWIRPLMDRIMPAPRRPIIRTAIPGSASERQQA